MANRFLSNIRINDAYTFPASDGTNNQVIKTDGSGNLSFGQLAADSASVMYKDTFTGDGSTTGFSLANALNDEVQSNIYIDGVYQSKSTYSVSGTTVTFSTAPASGHEIEVISTTGINSGPTAIYTDTFTANGSATAFTLGQTVHDENQTIVFLNGVYQFKGTYTLSGTTLTLDTAPANGVAIEVMSIGSAYSGGDILYDHDFGSAGLMTTNGSGVYSITGNNSANWNTAYGWGDHSTQSYATQSYVGTQISNLVDSSPATLNTLNELAAALGDDPNFATTTANSIGTKMPLAGGTFTGNVGFNDSTTLSLGASADLFLIHDATNSIIGNSAGNLIIRNDTDDGDIIFQSDNGSGGRDNYLTIDGGVERTFVHKLMRFDDDVQLRLGDNNDIRLYHNSTTGNNNFENHTGSLYIANYADDGDVFIESDDGSGGATTYLMADGGTGSLKLFYYGSKKFETTSTGVKVATTGINQSSTIRIQGTDGNGNDHPLDLKMDGAADSFSILIGQGGGATPSTVLFSGNRNGNVGIGTNSPPSDHRLQIHNADAAYSRFALTNSSTGVASGDGLIFQMETLNSIIKNQENGFLAFGTNGRETDLRIDSSGNVLINATSKYNSYPASFITQTIASGSGDFCPILELVGNRDANAGNQNAMIQFFNKTSTAAEVGRITSSQGSATNSGQLQFHTANAGTLTERMRINSSGNITILNPTSTDSKHIGITNAAGTTGWTFGNGITANAHQFVIYDNTAGSSRMLINSSGNVGIGTTSPTTRLSVSDGAAMYADNNYLVQIKRNATNSNDNTSKSCILLANNSNAFQIAYGGTTDRLRFINGGGVEQMTLLNGGNVGIGLTDPSWQLEVSNTGTVRTAISSTNNGTAGVFFRVFNSGTQVGNGTIRTDNGGNMSFWTGTSGEAEKMRITSGTGAGESSTMINYTNSNIETYGSGAYSGKFIVKAHTTTPNAAITCLNGNVGGDNPVFINFVNEFVSNQYNYLARIAAAPENTWTGTASTRNSSLNFYTNNAGTSAERMRITSDGDVQVTGGSFYNSNSGITYIGKNSEFEFVDAVASATKRFRPGVDNSFDLGDSSRRWDDLWATNPTIQTSDRNEKNNIKDTDLGLDFINKLKPVSYIWNNKTRTHYGLIAQDVQKVLEDISKDTKDFAGFIKADVSEEKDNSKHSYGLRYNEFIAPMIKAIQELKADNDSLKARIETLENN